MHAASDRPAGPLLAPAHRARAATRRCASRRGGQRIARARRPPRRGPARRYRARGARRRARRAGPACSAARASRASRRSAIATSSSSLPPNTSSAITARRPSSLAAATDAPVNDASTTVVAPPRIASSAPRRASSERIALGLPGLALDVDVEPWPEGQPVAEPPEARVLEVCVEVDEPGREHAALVALDGRVRVRRDHVGSGPDLDDRAIRHRHGAVSDGIRSDRDDPVGAQHERPAHEAPATGSFVGGAAASDLHQPRNPDRRLVQHQQRQELEQHRHGVDARQQRRDRRQHDDRVAAVLPHHPSPSGCRRGTSAATAAGISKITPIAARIMQANE